MQLTGAILSVLLGHVQ